MGQYIATGPEARGAMLGFCFFPPLGISNVLGVITRKFFDPIPLLRGLSPRAKLQLFYPSQSQYITRGLRWKVRDLYRPIDMGKGAFSRRPVVV